MKNLVWALLWVLCSVGMVQAMDVPEMVVTTGVEQRVPVDAVEIFPAADGRLYCFTRVVGGEPPTSITHVWYYGAQEMARVPLNVKSADWRTWSSKRILPGWVGDWRVEALDDSGQTLQKVTFKVE